MCVYIISHDLWVRARETDVYEDSFISHCLPDAIVSILVVDEERLPELSTERERICPLHTRAADLSLYPFNLFDLCTHVRGGTYT